MAKANRTTSAAQSPTANSDAKRAKSAGINFHAIVREGLDQHELSMIRVDRALAAMQRAVRAGTDAVDALLDTWKREACAAA